MERDAGLRRMKPMLLHYYITNRCNSRCSFCTIWTETPKSDAQTTDVINNLYLARKSGCRFVDFTGGEPLLHPELPLFLDKAKKLGFITSVTTNCILFPDRVPELAGKIDLLHFSIDADTAEQHDSIRGCTSFDRVLESIPLALNNRLVPDLLFTYTDENIDSLEGVIHIARKNRLIVILDPVFTTDSADTVSEITHQKAHRYSRRAGVYLNKAHLSLRAKGGNRQTKPLCRSVTSTIVISPDNQRLLPCFHHRTEFISLATAPLLSEGHEQAAAVIGKKQGTYLFCEGCHINCYFDPSYNYLPNLLFFQSLKAKLAYIIMKYFIYGHFRSFLRLY